MSLKSALKEVDKLKAEFEALKPLKKKDEDRLWEKFRLDWNYNSNHIEGNTLTYNETTLLLIFDKTTGDHTMREYQEMQAHDVAIEMVEDLANDKERPLTEQFIRDINKILLVKPFWKNAITPDKQPTRRKIIPGEYKDFPNSVQLQNGGEFEYASPQEVPVLMSDLITSYNTSVAEGKHPIEVAAALHYKFVRIHPFDDGNGRVARLIMNYHLLKNGYLPVIIKSELKEAYRNALNKTDVLNLEVGAIENTTPFAEYIANQLLWSYEIGIKAANGESIIEVDDYKKILRKINNKTNKHREILYTKDSSGIQFFFKQIFITFLVDFYLKSTHIKELFLYFNYELTIFDDKNRTFKITEKSKQFIPLLADLNSIRKTLKKDFNEEIDSQLEYYKAIDISHFGHENPLVILLNENISKIRIEIAFEKFRRNDTNTFSIIFPVDIILEKNQYHFNIIDENESVLIIAKYYDELITDEEIETILFTIAKRIEREISK